MFIDNQKSLRNVCRIGARLAKSALAVLLLGTIVFGALHIAPAYAGLAVQRPLSDKLRDGQSTPTVAFSAPTATFTVTTASDSGPGSLRDAITQANAMAGADTINFAIGSGLQTINLLSALSALSETVTIDGTTQPGFAGAPLIELRGTSAGATARGLQIINVANCLIKGLVVNGFAKTGVFISGGAASGNQVQGCYIGTNAAGMAAVPNGTATGTFDVDGLDLVNGAHNNIIGGTTAGARNVISGQSGSNNSDGIFIGFPGSNNNIVQGNYIGLNAAGTAAIPNKFNGVEISSDAAPGPQGNIIGGTVAGAGNVISGNLIDGVDIANSGTNNNLVQGNYIGTNASGTEAIGNGFGINPCDPTRYQGVELAFGAQGNMIGGTTPGARNLISGNAGAGVALYNPGTSGNFVQGNFIGTDASGTLALSARQTQPNAGCGAGAEVSLVSKFNPTQPVLLNGFAPVAPPNGAAPAAAVGNGLLGVGTANFATSTTIGGSAPGAGNTIAFNGTSGGVFISSGLGNTIRGNSIFSNGGLGIDLAPQGVNANDNCDGVFGVNNLQNFPVLTAAASAASTMIQGTLNSAANTTFTLEFFANPACDPSGNGEGKTFIGSMPVTTNGSCMASFNFTFPTADPGGQSVTATATDPAGNTSEFSACIQVIQSCFFSIAPANQTFTASGGSDMVAVTAPGGCNWTAVSNASFITINSGSSGTGNGTVAYSVAPNNSPNSRTGTMTIAGQTFTLTQTGCQFSISPMNQTFTASGGSSSVGVTALSGCSWTAMSNDGFITITSGSGGSGNGTVNYTVAANMTPIQRIGTLTIAGQTFTVMQAEGCSVTISPTSQSFTASGGTGSVTVTASTPACMWLAVSNAPWISLSGPGGTGSGAFGFTVQANTSPARTGTFTIAGNTFTVTQDGGCVFTINPTSQSFTAAGGAGSVNVTAGVGCTWTATSNAGFITITSGASGSGNGTVNYSVAANVGPARPGTLTIAGQIFTVNQASGCVFTLSAASQHFSSAGGTGTVNVTTAAGCAWTAASNDAFITVTSGATGSGNGTVGYTVAANAGLGRTGTLTIASQTFTVTQSSPRTAKADFDGDGRTDLSVWRGPLFPSPWLTLLSGSNNLLQSIDWGTGQAPYFDVPVPGDYDGDGKTDQAIWRGGDSTWYIRPSSDPMHPIVRSWGASYAPYFDIPVPGDYDGDGRTDIAVWRPAEGKFYVKFIRDDSIRIVQWGTAGDTPVPADYDGDGITDFAVWRGSEGNWYILKSTGGSQTVQWGAGYAPYFDVPVPADYDGDGKTDIAVWRGADTTWYIKRSAGGDSGISWGSSSAPYFDVPVPGDYDGDGKADIAIWRPAEGRWYVKRSSVVTPLIQQHGQAGDTPVPANGVR